ncbi:Smr/MutS family protein [Azovibrio restrictus]|uniref:Smr/MutS family protein n=1 Tax=Azovibrio restrictus TaxID=146938 RepID=UPI0026F32321|nr:Smr/MutS family protein [Azovibrio restrictus]
MARRRALHPAFDALADLAKKPARAPQPPKTPKTAPLTPDDRALFRAAMEGVRPLPPSDRAQLEPPRPSPLPRQRQLDEAAALAEALMGPLSFEDRLDMGIEDAFLRPGLPRRLLSDLRKGRWVIQAELDLHGLYRDEAREELAHFLAACLLKGYRCVRIIHGKGLSSPGGESVLKALSRNWLARRDEILAFCQAKPHDGGEGALLALLKAPKHRG